MGGGVKIVILSASTSTQIPNHKTSQKRTTGKVEKNYKMFANPVFTTPGRFAFKSVYLTKRG